MKKVLIGIITGLIIALTNTAEVSAGSFVAESSATIRAEKPKQDIRVVTLRNYLESHNSPLSEHAEAFVAYADEYNLDWRLVAAISGVESTFGKRIPQNSYNAYGWANGTYRFSSWEESIETVSRTLRTKYIDKGATSISKIARIYAPPSSTWARNVKFFMRKIEPMPVTYSFDG